MSKQKKRIMRFLFRHFILLQETPETFRRWLVVTATIFIIFLFSLSIYVFMVDMQIGITADHERFVSIAASMSALTPEPLMQDEQKENEGRNDSTVPIGVMTPLPASTSAPAQNVVNMVKTK